MCFPNASTGPRPEGKVWSPSDNILTPADAWKLFKEGKLRLSLSSKIVEKDFLEKFLEISPVTPAAHQQLKAEKLEFDRQFRTWQMTEAKKLGHQLNSAATQALKKRWQVTNQKMQDDYKELLDLHTDETSPNKDGVEVCVVCKVEFEPKSLFLLRDGQRVISKITQEPVRIGNYKILRLNKEGEIDPTGERTIAPACRDCSRDIGGESYTYENAQAAIKEADDELAAQQNHMKKVELARKSLTRPDGSHRFNDGESASEDMDRASRLLDSRRQKGKFQGRRR